MGADTVIIVDFITTMNPREDSIASERSAAAEDPVPHPPTRPRATAVVTTQSSETIDVVEAVVVEVVAEAAVQCRGREVVARS